MKELLEQLQKIDKRELLKIFYSLLVSKDISFPELSKVYVEYLENMNHDHRDLICELGFALVQYKDNMTGGTKEQLETKANNAIIRSKLFKGTPYEEKLITNEKDKNTRDS